MTLNGTATVNATLASDQRTVSGTVTAAVGGAALADAAVRVERRVQTQDDVRWRVVADRRPRRPTAPGAPPCLTAPTDIGFSREGYLDQWYSGAALVGERHPRWSSAAATCTGLHAAMTLGGTISGTVTGPAGAIVDGSITVYREVAPGDFEDVDYAFTNATGGYTVGGPGPRRYAVGSTPPATSGSTGTTSRRWPPPTRIAVTVGGTATASALLAAARKLSGTVTGPTGSALAGVDVTVEALHDYGGGDSTGTTTPTRPGRPPAPGRRTSAGDLPGPVRAVRLPRRVVGQRVHRGSRPVRGGLRRRRGVDQRPAGSGNDAQRGPGRRTGRPVSGQVRVYPASATDLATAPAAPRLHRLRR